MTTKERVLSAGEMRAIWSVDDGLSAAWQTKSTIAVVLVVVDGEYEGGFISGYAPEERSPLLLNGRIRVAVNPSTAHLITSAIRSGQPVPEEAVIQRADEEGGAERWRSTSKREPTRAHGPRQPGATVPSRPEP